MGLPRVMQLRPMEIIQIPGRMLQIFEWTRTFREIWADGRPLPVEPDPKWLGWSVGAWEGDTFVVKTTGFDERAWLDNFGYPHSEGMILEERYRRVRPDVLELQMTITDPKAYTKTWVGGKKGLERQPKDFKMREEFCVPSEEEEFNKGVRDPAGGVINK
jgi:hypothetical protein